MSKLIPAITVKNLALYYGSFKALQGVSLNIYQQQVTALIGSSGCGKSALIKSLNRIGELEANIKVDGKVEFFGQDIYSSRVNLNRLRRQIGMVFPKPNLFPMSIYDNVAYGIRVARHCPKSELDGIVESAIKDAVLWDEVKNNLNKSALSLSSGQQQRLCIARTLAVKPRVLLMDEPCSVLEPVATMKIEELIESLRGKLTIVIVSDNMQQAQRIADFIAFFSTDENRVGQMLEFGTTEQIFKNPLNQRTRDYVSGHLSLR
ncbi:MAG: phosphate ABC transporter ATP-binding protein [Richelia sp. RM2_1_2]|nr:phosphate ABC transporter ATP-binding protein [Richelia sp. SM2_1_7]NJM19683.1 phosphate ABC transporter ATP-binding protein [Richelia sp. SM1_7_0]NJN09678.1 phosphate ABC transporter ATP-binding protein [Richelia sp. RM1_1_1]NJO27986.1 phosphate ABC transporter ATP-binding protein [Richelia sp. SL_2_1]NJO59812.1 phosphate ABC transporter ATP-binding protein [Richelia sp. RM2_1_2]